MYKYKLVKDKPKLPIINTSKLEVKESTIPEANLGVFATVDIKKDEIVEIAPFLRIPKASWQNNILKDYVFTETDKIYLLVLGYGAMYNHSFTPNLIYEYHENDYYKYVANRNIKSGEELFISYGNDYWNSRDKKCN
jgi:SET domain-containing protein